VRRDFDALENRRMQAAKLLKEGVSEAEVARRVGVHRQSVNRWSKQMEKSGRTGLRKAGRAGRKPQLSESDRKKIEKGLKKGPEALGYESNLWTSARVADLIEQECGIQYHPGHVWKILRHLGWSCQRPVGRALERNEKAIQQWKKQRWPDIKKKPGEKGGPSSSSTKAD
jgi:transposase